MLPPTGPSGYPRSSCRSPVFLNNKKTDNEKRHKKKYRQQGVTRAHQGARNSHAERDKQGQTIFC
jgi:hypothetical protein